MQHILEKLHYNYLIRIIKLLLLIFLLTSNNAYAAVLSKDFNADSELPPGTIVSLEEEARKVIKSNVNNIHNIYGVVVDQGDIEFKSDGESHIVPVANNGIVPVLVSSNNGDIEPGDAITVNQIEGIGEKATTNGRMVGIAQESFSTNTSSAKQVTVDLNSSNKDIVVGLIPVKLGVNDYTSDITNLGSASEQERNTLEKIADSFAGKQVKPFALIIAVVILIIGVFIATFLVTSTSFASVISIGRNPFAKKNIIRSLLGLILLSVGIFGASVGLAYLVLILLG